MFTLRTKLPLSEQQMSFGLVVAKHFKLLNKFNDKIRLKRFMVVSLFSSTNRFLFVSDIKSVFNYLVYKINHKERACQPYNENTPMIFTAVKFENCIQLGKIGVFNIDARWFNRRGDVLTNTRNLC